MISEDPQKLESDAEKWAAVIGGLVAILLLSGRHSRGHTVEFRDTFFYIDGRRVPAKAIRDELRRIELRFGSEVRRETERLFAGRITADEWQTRVSVLIFSGHVLSAGLAAGSIRRAIGEQATRDRISRERRFFEGFTETIAAGLAGGILFSGLSRTAAAAIPVPQFGLTIDSVAARARSYLIAATNAYPVIEQVVKSMAGYSEAKRIRRAAESCPGCIRYAGRWIPIAEMPPIGTLQCRNYCRCYLIYR